MYIVRERVNMYTAPEAEYTSQELEALPSCVKVLIEAGRGLCLSEQELWKIPELLFPPTLPHAVELLVNLELTAQGETRP
jgi:hypothetical protein